MPGIPRKYAEHKLHVRKDAKPVRQPLRRFSEEKRRTIGEEVAKLLAGGFIMEVFHPEWLANPARAEKEQDLAHVYRLHQPQQSLSQGFVRPPTD